MLKYLSVLLLACTLVGCGSLNQTAYKATSVTITMVNVAEDYWGDLVRAGKATGAQQAKVRDLVNKYNAAMFLYRDAVDASFDGSTAASPVAAVLAAANASRADLFNAILAFLPADKQTALKAAITPS